MTLFFSRVISGIFLCIAVWILIGLMTFDPALNSFVTDNSWSTHYVGIMWLQNWCISLLLFLFGSASILMPIFLCAFSYHYWQQGKRKTSGYVVFSWCTALVLTAAYFHHYAIEWYANFTPGGAFGYSIDYFLTSYFDELLIRCFFMLVAFIIFLVCCGPRFLITVSATCYQSILYGYSTFLATQNFLRKHRKKNNRRIKKPVLNKSDDYMISLSSIFARKDQTVAAENWRQRSATLEYKLRSLGIFGRVIQVQTGPVVTLFSYEPEITTKVQKILSLEHDIALALQAQSLRIIAPIPGQSVVGFEVANIHRSMVWCTEILLRDSYKNSTDILPLIIGKNTIGNDIIIDLAKAPHILVAGSTGSGKSVALNVMLVSLLGRCAPEEVRIIIIDPKRLEFSSYADIPHLLFPVVTEVSRAAAILQWCIKTMEERYQKMGHANVRSIQEYNERQANDKMPYIVIMIDELADLIMTVGQEIETRITRLAQMARAAGIHLIVATQRPSVDVITGLIKVNFPLRIAFKVISKVDSRTILDYTGAEKLLGKGDMLFLNEHGMVQRAHGAFMSDTDIHALINHIKKQYPVHYGEIDKELAEISSIS